MCGRFLYLSYGELSDVTEALRRGFTVELLGTGERGQARPGSVIQAITPEAGDLAIESFTWGFEGQGGKLVFNTRIESALGGSPFWKHALQEGRGVLPVASFFEPHATETERNAKGRQVKRQYEFRAPGNEPLLLASVQQDGRLSIVTTEPNEHVAPIHARMPLILGFHEVQTWLEGDFATLVKRAGVQLDVAPENPDPQPDQLSLF